MNALLGAYHGDPFAVLGMHQAGNRLAVRVIRPDARAMTVSRLKDGKKFPAKRLHEAGFFEAILPAEEQEHFDYETRGEIARRPLWKFRDPYSFGQILGPMDLHLFSRRATTTRFTRNWARTLVRDGRGPGLQLRRLGAECPAGERHRRFQRLGRAVSPDAQAARQRRLGDFHPGRTRGGALQV